MQLLAWMLTRIEMFFMDWILDHHRVLGITNTETLAFKSKTYITATTRSAW